MCSSNSILSFIIRFGSPDRLFNSPGLSLIALIVLLVLIALYLLWQAKRHEATSGIPGGRIIYSDTRQWGAVKDPLYDPLSAIAGKPDYLIEKGDMIIPVEVKTGHKMQEPYDAHIYQLAAYCYLTERVLRKRPKYGILHYSAPSIIEQRGVQRTYAIDYTPTLEARFLDLISAMRHLENKKNVGRSHESLARCHKCGFWSICDQCIG